eukprot:1301501-Amphidinium_carterae.1
MLARGTLSDYESFSDLAEARAGSTQETQGQRKKIQKLNTDIDPNKRYYMLTFGEGKYYNNYPSKVKDKGKHGVDIDATPEGSQQNTKKAELLQLRMTKWR